MNAIGKHVAMGKGVFSNLRGGQTDSYKLLTAFGQMNAEYASDVKNKNAHIASSLRFNLAIAFLIIINTVLIGVEVDHTRGDRLEERIVFFIFDLMFAVAFFVEMLVRQNQLGWDYFLDPWNVFDYCLVVLNCADIVVAVSQQGSGGMKLASTFRVFRLLRVVRYIAGLKMFYGLWMIIRGMLDSLRTMGWVALTLFIIIYCFAVTLTTLVAYNENAAVQWRYSDQYTGTVYRSMWTVLQVITLDSWATDVMRPLSHVSPLAVPLLFCAMILCTFGVMNIIIAVMVERMQTIAADSKELTGKVLEKTEQLLLSSMAEEFCDADLDGNGELDVDEFRRMIARDTMRYKLRLLGVMSEEAESLFDIMDADKSGSVSPEEFVTGLQKLKGFAKGQDLVQLICFAQKQCLRAGRFLERLEELNEKADEIQGRLNGIGKGITHELYNRKHATVRNDQVWQRAAERQEVISTLDRNRQLQFPSLRAPI